MSSRKKLRLDLETLQCPICTEPFSPPVFQCANGHTACSSCCEKMITRGCPFCSLPIGRVRCLAIEKVVESVELECSHHGCATVLSLRDREEHERLCHYRAIKCPMPDCAHQGPMHSIPKHLLVVHETISAPCGFNKSYFLGDFSRDRSVLIQAQEAWVLVSWLSVPTGHWFSCVGVWLSKEAEVKLAVMPRMQVHKRVYSLKSALRTTRDLDHTGGLFIPRVPDGCFQFAIVVGCGDFFQGAHWDGASGLDRALAEQTGMMATVMNAISTEASMESVGVPTRVQSAVSICEDAEPYIRWRAIHHLEKATELSSLVLGRAKPSSPQIQRLSFVLPGVSGGISYLQTYSLA